MSKNDDHPLALLDRFDEVIYLALQSGLIHDAAFYAERCSRWLANASPNRSGQYLNFARRQYDFWGATAKVREITVIQPPSTFLQGFGKSINFRMLIVAILPSPSNEYKDPFARGGTDENPTTSVQSAISAHDVRQTSAATASDNLIRPSLRKGNSSASIHTSASTEDSHRRNSALEASSSSGPRDSEISSELDLQSVMRASLAIQEGPEVKSIILKLVHIIMQTAGASYGCVMLRDQRLERKSFHIEVIGNGNKINLVDHKPLHSQTDLVPARLCEYGLRRSY
jgi:osomolarity two-component system, sensor histidine kinase CHK1